MKRGVEVPSRTGDALKPQLIVTRALGGCAVIHPGFRFRGASNPTLGDISPKDISDWSARIVHLHP